MPITFAHPAAILPFVRMRRESGWLGSLVAGSVAPDILQSFFGYTNRLPHSALGAVVLDLPVALGIAWSVHWAIGTRLRRMPGLQEIRPATPFSWSLAVVGAGIGVVGHLVLDLFTHSESPLARSGWLAEPLAGTELNHFTVADLLWYVGSVAGSLSILGWLLRRARRVPGGLGRFLSWKWGAIGIAAGLPAVPVAIQATTLYRPELLEFFNNLSVLNKTVRWSLFASAAFAAATFFAVTGDRGKSAAGR